MRMKWTVIVFAAAMLLFAVLLRVNAPQQAKADPAPEPLIKFEGDKVIYSENMPDCH